MYRVTYKKAATKMLRKLSPKHRGRFNEAFQLLAQDPERGDLDVKSLVGRPGWRLRIGGWRAIYEVKGDDLLILVLDIGPRGGVYK